MFGLELNRCGEGQAEMTREKKRPATTTAMSKTLITKSLLDHSYNPTYSVTVTFR